MWKGKNKTWLDKDLIHPFIHAQHWKQQRKWFKRAEVWHITHPHTLILYWTTLLPRALVGGSRDCDRYDISSEQNWQMLLFSCPGLLFSCSLTIVESHSEQSLQLKLLDVFETFNQPHGVNRIIRSNVYVLIKDSKVSYYIKNSRTEGGNGTFPCLSKPSDNVSLPDDEYVFSCQAEGSFQARRRTELQVVGRVMNSKADDKEALGDGSVKDPSKAF